MNGMPFYKRRAFYNTLPLALGCMGFVFLVAYHFDHTDAKAGLASLYGILGLLSGLYLGRTQPENRLLRAGAFTSFIVLIWANLFIPL